MSLSHHVLPSLNICIQPALTTYPDFFLINTRSAFGSQTQHPDPLVQEDQSPAAQILMTGADMTKTF